MLRALLSTHCAFHSHSRIIAALWVLISYVEWGVVAFRVRPLDGAGWFLSIEWGGHRAAADRRPRRGHRWRHLHRRPPRQRRSPEGPRHRDGLPELRAVPAHDGVRQPGVRPEAAKDAQG